MHTEKHSVQVYQDLADYYEQENKPRMRDAFILLAADAAFRTNDHGLAERLHGRLLRVNPHHLLKVYQTFSESLHSPDVQFLLEDLREKYPIDVAEDLLDQLWELPMSNEDEEDEEHEEIPAPPKQPKIPKTKLHIDLEKTAPPPPPVIPIPKEKKRPIPSTPKPRSTPRRQTKQNQSRPTSMPRTQSKVEDLEETTIPPTLPLGAQPPADIPQQRPRSRPIRPKVEPPQPTETEPELKRGAWFATILVLIAFFAALAGLGYFLIEPFLQP